MISLRLAAGPCRITIFDTITKVGPTSTIEVSNLQASAFNNISITSCLRTMKQKIIYALNEEGRQFLPPKKKPSFSLSNFFSGREMKIFKKST